VTINSFQDIPKEYRVQLLEEQHLTSAHASTHESKTSTKAKKKVIKYKNNN